MAQNLVEAYKNRLAVANKIFAESHNGEKMDNQRTIATAKCLENVNRFMNESFENSVGTQRSDMGLFKKFTMNLTNVAIPNLIAFDLVIVYPMTSMSGYITYIEYTYGTNKGNTEQGTVFNDPFKLGNVDVNYTGNKLVEAKTAGVADSTDTKFEGSLNWKPVIKNNVEFIVGSRIVKDNGEGKLLDESTEVGTIDYATGAYSFKIATATVAVGTACLVNYVYDNVYIPQNDLPIINAQMKSIALTAKARRIAVKRYAAQLFI